MTKQQATFVIPGEQRETRNPGTADWIPACAGMTTLLFFVIIGNGLGRVLRTACGDDGSRAVSTHGGPAAGSSASRPYLTFSPFHLLLF